MGQEKFKAWYQPSLCEMELCESVR